jgi:hypothetical protein
MYEIFTEDEFINESLDKDIEAFLDKYPNISTENLKIRAYKTSDELDEVYYFVKKGYKIAKIIRHDRFTSIIFMKIKDESKI